MKKHVASLLLAVVLVVFILPVTSTAAGTLSNFSKITNYNSGQFTDVSNEWFAPYVQTAYEYGLMNGTSPTAFSPGRNLTIAEALKLASCLRSIFNTGTAAFTSGSPWYQPYVDYALQNGIIKTPYADYNAYATRSDFALIFANALPDEALTAKNTIADNSIPDVSSGSAYGPAVYKLYRAGILTGSDSSGTFYPGSYITRDAVAAITSRMANPAYRQTLTFSGEFTATDIASKSTSAVFYIVVYDIYGKVSGNASGFFISSSGLAVTNFHVIDGAASAKITTRDGKTYDVAGVYDFSVKNDLALLQINGNGFEYLNVGNSDSAETGSAIYAVGFPLGIDQTFTKGTITNASHTIDGVPYIMIDASISPGSSGGALLNTSGQVIGVTSAGYTAGQNLNLAMPINLLQSLKQANHVPMNSLQYDSNTPIKAAPLAVTVKVGQIATVAITDVNGGANGAEAVSANTAIAGCSMSGWNYTSVNLYITGLKAGTTTVTAYLLGSNYEILSSETISVTVEASSNSTNNYYSGYYPVSDWGVFTGTPLYLKSDLPEGTTYFYKMSDVKVGSDIGLDQYYAELEDNGFSFYSSYYDTQDYLVTIYTNQKWDVMVGLMNINGTVCMAISVFAS